MSHSLVEILYSDWQELLDLYKDRKKCSSAYSLILNYINWKKSEPEIDAKIYSLDGDWKNNGTFVLIDSELFRPHVYFNTLSNDMDCLRLAISCLDKNLSPLFYAIQERHSSLLDNYFKGLGLQENEYAIDGTVWYHIEREKALAFETEPPEGITLSSLQLNNAQQINSIWPHRSEGSIRFVERLIASNVNIGAFDKDGNLVAWCLRLPVGSLGVLQVADTHKRQGLGGLMVRNMARTIALKDEEVFAPVIFKNIASHAMFEKLGFHGIDKVYWGFRLEKNVNSK